MSRIGKRPVELPSGVEAAVSGQTVTVKGPKGSRAFTATDDVTIAVDDGIGYRLDVELARAGGGTIDTDTTEFVVSPPSG